MVKQKENEMKQQVEIKFTVTFDDGNVSVDCACDVSGKQSNYLDIFTKYLKEFMCSDMRRNIGMAHQFVMLASDGDELLVDEGD